MKRLFHTSFVYGIGLTIILCILFENTYAQESLIHDWVRGFDGNSSNNPTDNYGFSVAVDPSGNVLTTGSLTDTRDFDPGPGVFNLVTKMGGYNDAFILKLDKNGNFVWAKSIGGFGSDYGFSIDTDAAGNVFVAGQFDGTVDLDPGPGTLFVSASGPLGYDIFLLKLDPNGNLLWARKFGNNASDEFGRMKVDGGGNPIVTGYLRGTFDFDPGPGVVNLSSPSTSIATTFVCKMDTDGNLVWATVTQNGNGTYPSAISIDASDNIIYTGRFDGTVDFDPGAGTTNLTSNGTADIFVSKLSAAGGFVWARVVGGPTANAETSFAIGADPSGNVLVTGKFQATADFDPGAGVFNMTPAGTTDAFILKLDINGNFQWAKALKTNTYGHEIQGNAIVADAFGKVIVGGTFNGSIDFDPGPGTYTLESYGLSAFDFSDIFTMKLDENGNLIWAFTPFSSARQDKLNSIDIDPAGYIYETGTVADGHDFDPGPCKDEFIGNTRASPFITKRHTGIVGPPTITSISPASGAVGTQVTITGTFFSTTPSANDVRFAPSIAATVISSTATQIVVNVPAGAQSGAISLRVGCYPSIFGPNFTLGPAITSFTPPSGPVGTTVTIKGTNFSLTSSSNIIKFNGITATTLSSNATTLTAKVPVGATTGPITVTVAGNTGTSATDFIVSGGTAIGITTQPTPVTVCSGSNATFTTAATGTTNITYRWQFSSTLAGTYADISGGGYSNATTASLTVNTTGNFGAGFYKCRLNGDLAAQVLTNAAQLIVNLSGACGNQPPVIADASASTLIEGSVSLDLTSLVSDSDNNLDLQSLKIITQPISGAPASASGFVLTIDYHGITFTGTDRLTIEVCDLADACVQREISIEVVGDLIIYNGISPNDDGQNDIWLIRYIDVIEDAKDNKVSIFNRWGDQVFSTTNYDNVEKVFKGRSESGNELPSGTYFYKIDFAGGRASETGYLTLKK